MKLGKQVPKTPLGEKSGRAAPAADAVRALPRVDRGTAEGEAVRRAHPDYLARAHRPDRPGSASTYRADHRRGHRGAGDLAQLESSNLIRNPDLWKSLIGVGLVVATEMGIAWYFLERFGRRVLKANSAIKLVLAASLMILFTALARLFIELNFNPYLTPLAGLSIIGTMLLGPRIMFPVVVITSINVGIMSGNDFLLTAALLLGSGFAIYTVVRVRSRQQLLKAGLFIALVTAVVTFAVGLLGGGTPPKRCGRACWVS